MAKCLNKSKCGKHLKNKKNLRYSLTNLFPFYNPDKTHNFEFDFIYVLFAVDLVTLDDLSPEAMMESSERVGHLSDIYQRKCEPLSDPGPPGIMPPKIRRANLLTQIFVLWIRALIYMYPFNVINWVKMVLLAGAMSVCVGAVFVGAR